MRSRLEVFTQDNARMVRVGRGSYRGRVLASGYKMEHTLRNEGIPITVENMARALKVRERDVRDVWQFYGSRDFSLNAPLHEDGESATYLDALVDAGATPEDRLADAQLGRLIRRLLDDLDLGPLERLVVEERLLADDPATLKDLGARVGVTRERIRQVQNGILARLGDALRPHLELTVH